MPQRELAKDSTKDSFVIKLSGKAELGEPLKIGHNFRVLLEGSIVEETIADNEDGSRTHYFKFRPVIVETIDEKGERLRAKDTRSRGQQLRSQLWREWKEGNEDITVEEHYEREMLKIMQERY